MIRRLTVVLAALALALGGVAVSASPASAAATKCGSACNDKDPQTYGNNAMCLWLYSQSFCNANPGAVTCAGDATTPTGFTKGGVVALRYSPRCQTAWAKFIGSGSPTNVTLYIKTSTGHTYYDDGTAGAWSRMTDDAGITSKACADVDSEVTGVTTYCTSSY